MGLSEERRAEFLEIGIRMPDTNPTITANLTFEPPITLNNCFIVGSVFIGRFSYIGNFTHVDQNTCIGRYCGVASSCTIAAQRHPLNWLSSHPFQYCAPQEPESVVRPWVRVSTEIGHDVLIGAGAIVMEGVTIGHGAVIGAGSLVTKNVPPYAIVFGSPARIIRYRFDERMVAELLELEWWNLPEDQIARLPFDDIRACIAMLLENRIATC